MDQKSKKLKTQEKLCYVCGHKIKGSPVYIGQERYRHDHCFPGSQRWLKSEIGRLSDLYELFIEYK